MKKKTYFLLVAVLIGCAAEAQTTFQKTYGGVNDDEAYNVQQTADGGYIIAGSTTSFGAGYEDVYLIKTNAIGDTLWTKVIGEANTEWAYSIQQTSDGGYIIGGWGGYNSLGVFYLIKTDSNGNVIWSKRYASGIYDSVGTFAQQTNDGGYIITGYTWNYGAGDEDILLIKTDSNGNIVWAKTFGLQVYDEAFQVRQTADGGYIIIGYTFSFTSGTDVFLIKTDSNGNLLWSKSYGGTYGDEGLSLQITSDGGFILAGLTNSFGPNYSYIYLIKTDGNGNMLWSKMYNVTNNDIGWSVGQTNDGGYFIAGYSGNNVAGTEDMFLIRTDNNGTIIWSKTYGGIAADGAYSASQTTDGGFIVAGYTSSFGAGNKDFYLIKTDSSGNSGCNENNIVLIDSIPSTQIIVPVTIITTPTVPYAATVTTSTVGSSLAQLCLITNNLAINVDENIYSLSPNPFTTTATIKFSRELSAATLRVYNLFGQLMMEKNNITGKEIVLNRENLASGIYVYEVTDKNKKICTGKAVVY